MFDLNDAIKNVVIAKIAANEVFTAYDITKAVREANRGENVPHYSVRDWVTGYFANGNMMNNYYGCVQTKLNNNGNEIWANVFFPMQTKSNFDHPLAVKPYPTDDDDDDSVDIDPDDDDDVDVDSATDIKDEEICYAGSEGRINIPKDLIKKMGVKPFDSVIVFEAIDINVSPYNHSIYIQNRPAMHSDKVLVCNKDGRIRINNNTLVKAFGDTMNKKFKVELDKDNSIVISLV